MPKPVLFRVSAHAVVRGREKTILLALDHSGYWCLPGGGLEPGETPVDALIRELREELNVGVRWTGTPSAFTCYEGPRPGLALCYPCRLLKKPVPGGCEALELRYVAPREAPRLAIHPRLAQAVAYYLSDQ